MANFKKKLGAAEKRNEELDEQLAFLDAQLKEQEKTEQGLLFHENDKLIAEIVELKAVAHVLSDLLAGYTGRTQPEELGIARKLVNSEKPDLTNP